MQVIASASLPEAALSKLKSMAEIQLFNTQKITYQAIANHPDIFLCPTENGFVVAKNIPPDQKNALLNSTPTLIQGESPVGKNYPESAHYNAVITSGYLIHNLKYTDPVLLSACSDKTKINVNQAYTRCNVLALAHDWFITSDRGIESALLNHHLHVLYVEPHEILLPGFAHGFFGGTCGIYNQTVWFAGSLNHLKQGREVSNLLDRLGYSTVELYDGPLFDGGSLFFFA